MNINAGALASDHNDRINKVVYGKFKSLGSYVAFYGDKLFGVPRVLSHRIEELLFL